MLTGSSDFVTGLCLCVWFRHSRLHCWPCPFSLNLRMWKRSLMMLVIKLLALFIQVECEIKWKSLYFIRFPIFLCISWKNCVCAWCVCVFLVWVCAYPPEHWSV